MSTNTGVPPALWIVPAVAKNVNGVVTTSSPGFRFSALSGKSSASVPLAQPMPCLACDSRAISASSCGTDDPMMNCCVSMTCIIAGRTSSLMVANCATRSSMGTVTTHPPAPERRSFDGVFPPTLRRWPRARRTSRARMEPLAALTHPADASRRHADHEPIGRDVGRHDGARADERILAQRDAAHDRRVGTDRAAALHERAPVCVLARHVTARVHDVGEDTGGTAEDVVFQLDALVDGHVVLDLDVVADPGPRHHDDVLAEVTPLADHGARHHMREVPDLGAVPDHRPVIDVAGFVREIVYTPMILHSSSRVMPVFFATVLRT